MLMLLGAMMIRGSTGDGLVRTSFGSAPYGATGAGCAGSFPAAVDDYGLAADETMVVLNRLQEVTEKAVQLQVSNSLRASISLIAIAAYLASLFAFGILINLIKCICTENKLFHRLVVRRNGYSWLVCFIFYAYLLYVHRVYGALVLFFGCSYAWVSG